MLCEEIQDFIVASDEPKGERWQRPGKPDHWLEATAKTVALLISVTCYHRNNKSLMFTESDYYVAFAVHSCHSPREAFAIASKLSQNENSFIEMNETI